MTTLARIFGGWTRLRGVEHYGRRPSERLPELHHRGAGSTGTATVSGSGFRIWTNREELVIGTLGSGSLTISGGGQVFDNSWIIGANPGADGAANITGVGSKWTQTGDLHLGSNSSSNGDTGPGTMHISAGGQVATGGNGRTSAAEP